MADDFELEEALKSLAYARTTERLAFNAYLKARERLSTAEADVAWLKADRAKNGVPA